MEPNLGLTIFQGSNNLHVNNTDVDEEEEKADQLRRNIELVENFQKYLNLDDDTLETEETNDFEINISKDNSDDLPRHTNELCRLRNELIAKKNEILSMQNIFDDEVKKKDAIINDLKKQVDILSAEKERALMSRDQIHELLIESKTRISNLENHEEKLKQKLESLKEENIKLAVETQQVKTMFSDLEYRHQMSELDSGLKKDAHLELIVKQLQEKHNAQIVLLQEQVDTLTHKLDNKEHELKNLNYSYMERERSKETILMDKNKMINHLEEKLEDNQKQLILKKNVSEEKVQLQITVQALRQQNHEMQNTINTLTKRLESLTKEMVLLDSLKSQNITNESVLKTLSEQKHSNTSGSSNKQNESGNVQLYEERKNDLLNEIQKRDKEIQRLKEIENIAMINSNESQKIQNKLKAKIEQQEEEIKKFYNTKIDASTVTDDNMSIINDELINDLQISKQILQKEIEKVKFDLKNALDDCERIKNLYIDVTDQKQKLLKRLHSFENQNEKDGNIEKYNCSFCNDNRTAIRNLEESNFHLKKTNESYVNEIDKLQQKIISLEQNIGQLNSKLGRTKKDKTRAFDKPNTLKKNIQRQFNSKIYNKRKGQRRISNKKS